MSMGSTWRSDVPYDTHVQRIYGSQNRFLGIQNVRYVIIRNVLAVWIPCLLSELNVLHKLRVSLSEIMSAI